MEYEWPETCVAVVSVLFPGGCASDGDYDSCACFADFYGRGVDCGDCCFLVIGFQRDWRVVGSQMWWILI